MKQNNFEKQFGPRFLFPAEHNLTIFYNPVFWMNNEDGVRKWLDNTGIRVNIGAVGITFENSEDMTTFMLRWG